MPFTYSVNAFRSAIGGGQPFTDFIKIFAVLAVVFTALTVVLFQVRAHREMVSKATLYDWLENKGLA